MLGPSLGLQFPVKLSHNVILLHTFTPLVSLPFRSQIVVCVSILMYWLWSSGLAPDRSSLHRQDTELSQPNVRPVTSKQLCSPHHHYTIYIVIVNRYSLIIILVCKSIPINDLATAGLPLTITPFGDQVGEMLWMGRSYFITSKFSGYDMSWSLLLTTISRLYGTCPSS